MQLFNQGNDKNNYQGDLIVRMWSGKPTVVFYLIISGGAKTARPKNPARRDFLLLCQGSNLNFSDPESDVLPITPRSTVLRLQIYKNFNL